MLAQHSIVKSRIVSIDVILDLDATKWPYSQNANYGNIIMPCDEKMKNR
jgi:hypothetical protein